MRAGRRHPVHLQPDRSGRSGHRPRRRVGRRLREPGGRPDPPRQRGRQDHVGALPDAGPERAARRGDLPVVSGSARRGGAGSERVPGARSLSAAGPGRRACVVRRAPRPPGVDRGVRAGRRRAAGVACVGGVRRGAGGAAAQLGGGAPRRGLRRDEHVHRRRLGVEHRRRLVGDPGYGRHDAERPGDLARRAVAVRGRLAGREAHAAVARADAAGRRTSCRSASGPTTSGRWTAAA